ncbi:MAG: hypothetical protein GWO02_05450 [Gammaproteobacteria bacterium]|nr:hypothetical protein [Gammaproteobacteria bacterium]
MRPFMPMSEDFLYCDPECVHDHLAPHEERHPCHLCFCVDALDRRPEPDEELCHEDH